MYFVEWQFIPSGKQKHMEIDNAQEILGESRMTTQLVI